MKDHKNNSKHNKHGSRNKNKGKTKDKDTRNMLVIDAFHKKINSNFIYERFLEFHEKNNPSSDKSYRALFVSVKGRYFCFNETLYNFQKNNSPKKIHGLMIVEEDSNDKYYFSDNILNSCEISKEYYMFCKKYKHN